MNLSLSLGTWQNFTSFTNFQQLVYFFKRIFGIRTLFSVDKTVLLSTK